MNNIMVSTFVVAVSHYRVCTRCRETFHDGSQFRDDPCSRCGGRTVPYLSAPPEGPEVRLVSERLERR